MAVTDNLFVLCWNKISIKNQKITINLSVCKFCAYGKICYKIQLLNYNPGMFSFRRERAGAFCFIVYNNL
jgi:hypothetical protein